MQASALCTDPWGQAAGSPGAPGSEPYAPAFCPGVGLWSIKGSWRSARCSASLQSNCLFPRRLSQKDDIYQRLLSGDLGERERGRVILSVEAGKENDENLEGRKCFHASKLSEQSGRGGSRFEDKLNRTPSCPLRSFTSAFSLPVPASPAEIVD